MQSEIGMKMGKIWLANCYFSRNKKLHTRSVLTNETLFNKKVFCTIVRWKFAQKENTFYFCLFLKTPICYNKPILILNPDKTYE